MRKTVALLLLVFALASAGRALTAPAPDPRSSGAAAVSGYAVADVHYALSAADPSRIGAVSFTLHPARASTVRIRFAAGGEWHACAAAASRTTCELPGGELLAAADRLEVTALG